MKRADISTHMQLECRREMVTVGRSSTFGDLVGPTFNGKFIWQRVEVMKCGDLIRVKVDNAGMMLADHLQWVPASWLQREPRPIKGIWNRNQVLWV